MEGYRPLEAYMDIETTGLSPFYSQITVVGIYRCDGCEAELIQLVGREITTERILGALQGVTAIYTYNGSRFDLPFIRGRLGIELEAITYHHDLMYDCWRCNLYGGFKAVERQLGIPRELKGITGFDAVLLWQRYQYYGDQEALITLLEYNKEDVMNLKVLRERLVK